MSLKGVVEARCPKGCPPEEIEVYSFIRGDDEAMREGLLGGELNLVLCRTCGQPFYPEVTVVYLDERARLLAFIFPESCKGEEERWRSKMLEDHRRMGQALGGSALSIEPSLFFGPEAFRAMLLAEEDLADEVRVAEHLLPGLGLAPYRVDRAAARRLALPWLIPLARADASRQSAADGIRALLSANPRLKGFGGWLAELEKGLPPREAGRK